MARWPSLTAIKAPPHHLPEEMKYLAKTRLGSAGRYSLEVFVTVLTSVTVLAHRPGQRECLLQTLPGGISHRPQQRSLVPFQGRVGMRGCGCGFFLFFAPPFFIGRLRGLLFLPIVSNVSQWHKPPPIPFPARCYKWRRNQSLPTGRHSSTGQQFQLSQTGCIYQGRVQQDPNKMNDFACFLNLTRIH